MENEKTIQLELKKIGLNSKEASLYMNSLKLGNVPVSKIAQKSKVTRPTAYRVLESLQKKGLVSFKKGLVFANSPDELLGMLRVKKREVEEQEREFLRIISALKSTHFVKKNSINVFEGKKGMELAMEEFFLTHDKDIKIVFSGDWQSILSYSSLEKGYKKIKNRLGKIEIREIFFGKSKKSDLDFLKKREAQKNNQDLIIIVCDKLLLVEKKKVLVIYQEDIVKIFDLLLTGLVK